jgi:hypothetical protein
MAAGFYFTGRFLPQKRVYPSPPSLFYVKIFIDFQSIARHQ